MKRNDIDPAHMRELFDYNPETGELRWKVTLSNRRQAGGVAGSLGVSEGRIAVRMYGVDIRAHIIAWAYMTGEWPAHRIDHRDRDPSNNRWNNLRPATQSQNMSNYEKPKNNTSGLKGVGWRADRKKWRAYIGHNGAFIHLGYFNTKEEAHEAYKKASRELHGEFSIH